MLFFSLLALVVLFLFHHFYWKRRNLPPGPLPLPFVGNLHTLTSYEPGYGAFEKWRNEYGPVFTFWLGCNPFVMVCDYETLKATFLKEGDAFAGKFNRMDATHIYRGGVYGVVDTEGDIWREHRRFLMQQLREFGVGKDVMQTKVLLEVDAVTKKLVESEGNQIHVQDMCEIAVGSIINQFLFGYRFDESKIAEFRELKSILTSQMHEFSTPFAFFVIQYSWTRHVFGKTLWNRLMHYRDQFYTFFNKQIGTHRAEIDLESAESKDYVEAFLKEQNRRRQTGDVGTFCDKQLINMCLDIWFAGMETTSNTLSWGIAYALHNPSVQEKIYEELDREAGSDRDITMSDKNRLPYLNAFINETQRMANLLPINLLHTVNRPVVLNGYQLTPGTGVCPQISSVLFDEKVFPNPNSFDPDRFIDAGGQLKKVDELIPFSIGKRQCPGEGLARMELFLLFANLFNRFNISGSSPSLEKRFGTTVHPIPFDCKFTRRPKSS